jgi:hypothetical protein
MRSFPKSDKKEIINKNYLRFDITIETSIELPIF